MLSTILGARLPSRYARFLKLPPRVPSTAVLDTAATELGQFAAVWLQQNAATNGVARLDLGTDALRTRLHLIGLAERTIDIQSYLVRDDFSGNLIALGLLDAAERGVRVRLLMDDALTKPVDPGLLALGKHNNIEVRVFNPFPRNRSRFLSFIANFNLLNRRMHNKSFTVDNQVTIVGGRNLADEYFQSSPQHEFLDEDLVAVGAVVTEVSAGFDEYWNTREAMPVEALATPASLPSVAELVNEGRKFIAEYRASGVAALDEVRPQDFLAQPPQLHPADAHLVLDHPDKVRGLVRQQVGETTEFLRQRATETEQELIVVSPYFVPLRAGVELFKQLVLRGVRVVIVTNSLASTNHSSVHAVYARYRKPLLRIGVELYELRRNPDGFPSDVTQQFTLHSKVAVADREELFVGSFNIDPRSLYINTEMGMAVRSTTLATEMADFIEELLPAQTYKLKLAENGALCWSFRRDGQAVTVNKEPHTTLWRRLSTWLMSLLPIERQM